MIPKNIDIRFEVTTKCRYNCVICPRDKLTRRKKTMDFALFKALLDKILSETQQYTTLTFAGMGEPLLDETLEEKISYAKKKNLKVLILTNGFLLNEDRFKRLEGLGVESIRVSFYGNDAKSYAKIHRAREKQAFEITRDNLNRIVRIRRRTNILLTLNVLKCYNGGFTKEWINYWNNKANLIEVWRPHNWVDGRLYRKIQNEKLKTCGRPFKGPLQVQVDGTVNMCCFDFNGKLTIGDLKTKSLKEIFSSPLYKKIVRCHKKGDFLNSGLICKNCDQRNKDKSDVMIYNSKFEIKERVKQLSTTYTNIF